MSGYYVKNPAAVLEQSFDWSADLGGGGEAIATDLGWSVEPEGTGHGGLTVSTASTTGSVTTARLSGGVPGDAYLVSSTVETDQGRRLVRSVVVRTARY